MGVIMTSDNEVISFEFYSSVQSSLYSVEFDASFDLDPEGKFGSILDDFFSLTISKSKRIAYSAEVDVHTELSECDLVGDEIENIIGKFIEERPGSSIYFSIDKEDNKEQARERLFERWYRSNGNAQNYYYELFPVENLDNGDLDKIGVIIPRSINVEAAKDAFWLSFTY